MMVSNNIRKIVMGLIKMFYPVVIKYGCCSEPCFNKNGEPTDEGNRLADEIISNLDHEIITFTKEDFDVFSQMANIYSKLGYTLVDSKITEIQRKEFAVNSGMLVTAILRREFDLDSIEVVRRLDIKHL